MRLEIVAREETHVVAGQQRQVVARRQRDRGGVEGGFALASGARQLQVQTVREGPAPFGQRALGLFGPPRRQQRPQRALAPGDRDQAGIVGVQPLGFDRHVVAGMAFQEGARNQPRQRQVTAAVLAEQGEPAGRAAVARQPQVGAGDGLEPGRFGGLVELHQREQVAGVGDRHGRQPERSAAPHQLRDADGGVGERILAVKVQVDEAGRHAGDRGADPQFTPRVGADKA